MLKFASYLPVVIVCTERNTTLYNYFEWMFNEKKNTIYFWQEMAQDISNEMSAERTDSFSAVSYLLLI